MVAAKFALALALLVAVTCTAAATETEAPSDTVRALRRPLCFQRCQRCCFKFFPCGKVCKVWRCFFRRICTRYIHGKCVKYQKVKVCVIRCYTRFCSKLVCFGFKKNRVAAPKTYLSKTFTTKTQRAK